jgi:anti-anti-sigma factor
MEMRVEDLPDGVVKVALEGKMDLAGAQKIDLRFNAVAGGCTALVIDMAPVTFLASMGIRTLIMGAKAMQKKGGRVAIFGPNPEVEKVLVGSGIDTLIPVLPDLESALIAVRA